MTDTSPDEAESAEPHVDIAFALEAAGLGGWEVTIHTKQIKLDNSCRTLLGLPRANGFTYQQILSRVHPDDVDRVLETLRWSMNPQSGGACDCSCRTIGADDGRLRWVRFMGRSYFTEAGEVYRVAGIAQDITRDVETQPIRAGEERFRSLIEEAPVAIAIFRGPSHIIELANEAHLNIWGRRAEEVIGKPVFDALPEVKGQGYEALLAGVYTTGEPFYAYELHAPLMRNGRSETVYFNFVYQALRESDGTISGIIVVANEVTQEVLARQREENEARFRSLVEQAPVAVALFDGPQFVITSANERVLAYWGRQREQVMGKPLFEALPEASGQGFEELLTEVLTTVERCVAKELTVTLMRNGRLETTYIDFVYEPFRAIDGTITGVTVVANEITGQVLARRKLQDEQNRLNTILNELPLGVLMANATGELIYGNRQVEEIFRHPFRESHDIEAYTNWQLFDPATNEPFPLERMPMVRTLLHGETVTGVEMKLRRGDDTWGYTSVNTVPIYDSAGQLQYGLSAFVDITERKHREANLAFLTQVTDEFARRLSAEEIMQTVGARIGQYMNLASVNFLDINEFQEKELTVSYFWGQPGVPILLGQYHIQDFLTEEFERACRAGETYVVYDTQTDPRTDAAAYASLAIGAYVNVPFHHQSRWTNIMAITDTQARMWRDDEIELFRELANRIFPRLARARAEESLRRSEERLQLAINGAHIFTWEVNVQTGEMMTSPNFREVLGFELATDARENFLNIHPEDYDWVTAATEQALREAEKLAIEHRITNPQTGETIWVQVHGQVIAGDSSSPGRFIGITQNITGHKLAELAVQASQVRLQKAIQIDTVGVLFFDDEGKFLEANDAFLTMTGYTREQFDKQSLATEDITLPEWMPRTRQAMDELKTKGLSTPYEKEFKRPDGSHWWGLTAGTKLTANENVEYIIDVSNRKQAEDSLRKADRRKDEFLATLAHELRNPLAPISNTLQILKLTAGNNETVAPAIAMMVRQVDHLVHLVDDLLDVSRISQGKLELRWEQIDLDEVVSQVVDAGRLLYEAGGREVTVTLPTMPIYLSGDRTRLAQIVSNLLNNATKFTHEGGHIWLNVERVGQKSGDTVLLRVRDDGIGIATDQLETIFELFNQADHTLERSRNGLGLGLTLVRQLVELHGGRVEAHSDGLGQGSQFTMHLPTLTDTPTPKPAADTNTKLTIGRRILVVDDNPDATVTLAMLLKLEGHQVHTRFSGQEGIAAAESLQPEVILLDIGMPGMNGYDTARLIRTQPWSQSMVLIALTGYGQEEDRRLSREAGFDAHLVKPVNIAAFTQLLSSLPAQPGNP